MTSFSYWCLAGAQRPGAGVRETNPKVGTGVCAETPAYGGSENNGRRSLGGLCAKPPGLRSELRSFRLRRAPIWYAFTPPVWGGSEQGGERAAGLVGGEQFAEVGEQGAVVQAAGDRGGEGSFGESFAVVGLVAVGVWRAGRASKVRKERYRLATLSRHARAPVAIGE